MTQSPYETLQTAAARHHLTLLGGFHPTNSEPGLMGCRTLVLLGPDEKSFWPHFIQSPEYLDGLPDPIDRWSTRVIDALAQRLEACAYYPFGTAPHWPFYAWALRSGSIHQSPVSLLVHAELGLFVSFRGAIGLREEIELPDHKPSPCLSCEQKPCLSACPVDAFVLGGYAVHTCRAHVAAKAGADCLTQGCSVRRSCPAGQHAGRTHAQSAYHMATFLRSRI